MPQISVDAANNILFTTLKIIPISALLSTLLTAASFVHADDMSELISQKSNQPELAVPAARVTTHSTIKRVATSSNLPANNTVYNNNTSPTPVLTYRYQQPAVNPTISIRPTITTVTTIPAATDAPDAFMVTDGYRATDSYNSYSDTYRYPAVQQQAPTVLPAFLSGSYDNVDSEYLPLLERAESQGSPAAREVMSTARVMALNERTIIQGGCWDYLNAVFKRAGVSRDTIHEGAYRQGPYANSSEIEIGDWLYYINHGYRGVEHSGMFVGWVDESAKQALILSYAGESRREPARYRVYDLSNVYQIMRPTV